MTVIAWDKTHIAWDGLATSNNTVFSTSVKKVKVVGGIIYAFAGDLGLMDVLIGWHQRGAKQQEFDKNNGRLRHYDDASYDLAVLSRNDTVLYTSDVHFKNRIPDIYAIGSGGPYAVGALLGRNSAFRSVQIACACDTSCGGNISVLPFESVWAAGRSGAEYMAIGAKRRSNL